MANREGKEVLLDTYIAEREKRVVQEKSYFSSAIKLRKGDELMIVFSGMSGSGGYTLTIQNLVVTVKYPEKSLRKLRAKE